MDFIIENSLKFDPRLPQNAIKQLSSRVKKGKLLGHGTRESHQDAARAIAQYMTDDGKNDIERSLDSLVRSYYCHCLVGSSSEFLTPHPLTPLGFLDGLVDIREINQYLKDKPMWFPNYDIEATPEGLEMLNDSLRSQDLDGDFYIEHGVLHSENIIGLGCITDDWQCDPTTHEYMIPPIVRIYHHSYTDDQDITIVDDPHLLQNFRLMRGIETPYLNGMCYQVIEPGNHHFSPDYPNIPWN